LGGFLISGLCTLAFSGALSLRSATNAFRFCLGLGVFVVFAATATAAFCSPLPSCFLGFTRDRLSLAIRFCGHFSSCFVNFGLCRFCHLKL
jgi:hypothetical protein